jgi:hypothetical protein
VPWICHPARPRTAIIAIMEVRIGFSPYEPG